MNNGLPYIPDHVGLPVACQPYEFSDAKMATFFLESQSAALNTLLDAYLNQPSNGQFDYRCLGADGKAFTVMIMAQMTVDVRNPDGQLYGNERYSELSFWIPCYDRNALKRGEFKPAVFLPYLFPDSFTAIATGREMFGFRKQLASFRYPGGELDLWRPGFTATTTGFKTLGAESVGKPYDFISLASGAGETVQDAHWDGTTAAATGAIETFLGKQWTCPATGEVLGTIGNDFLKDCPAVFLKQFPSIADAQQAEVRCIAAAPFQLVKFRGAFPWLDLKTRSLKQFDIRFERLASHPIVAQLGLTPQSPASPDADTVSASGFWADVDFQLDTGTTLANIAPPKQKIAVLGGGLGSLAAVYGITEQPDWQQKYDITVYQLGWRLGGKGASGRNREQADRVEEHGLHIWCGYYENAFQMIQKCYAELARPANAPLATWQQAFKPHNTVLLEEYVNNQWKNWPLVFRPNDQVPGDGKDFDDHPRSFFYHLREALDELDNVLTQHIAHSEAMRTHVAHHLVKGMKGKVPGEGLLEGALGVLGKPVEYVVEHEVEHFFAGFRKLYETFPKRGETAAPLQQFEAGVLEHWADVIKELQSLFQQLLQPFGEAIDSLRRIVLMVDLALAIGKGILADGVLLKGYDAINQYDFAQWLKLNGASDNAANSAPVRAFYDLVLGFPNGQREIIGDGVAIGGNVSAGEMLHSYILVSLCYKGAVMWKMQAGMGDTVMTPLYQVLKRRGVRFEFFNKVSELRLTADQQQIGEIDIDVQATLKPGLAEYNPLYDVKGLACWPSAPLYEQLVQGDQLKLEHIDLESSWSPWQPVAKKTLKLGQEFDRVVLGISVAALPYLTGQLMAANPKWKAMLDNANTSQSQAMQLWLNVNLEETGWPLPSPVLDGYGEPFNTWAAMDQTLDKENWPQNALPFTVAYFCNNMQQVEPIPPFSDHGYPARQKARVKEEARKWLQHYTGHLWPFATQAKDSSALDWSKLVDLNNGIGEARLDGQYFRANVDPTERYVCNAANTNQYRLKADGAGFSNLFLTGDWVNNGSLNLGCVESTVIAGLQAARALTGYPLPIHHESLIFG